MPSEKSGVSMHKSSFVENHTWVTMNAVHLLADVKCTLSTDKFSLASCSERDVMYFDTTILMSLRTFEERVAMSCVRETVGNTRGRETWLREALTDKK